MIFDNLPHELRGFRQWIVWRFEESEGKKPTKNLYCPNFCTQADVTKPHTWGTFEDALNRFNLGGWSGLGFVFTEADDFCGIDLDDANGDEEVIARHKKILEMFPSYTELSPSGTGFHIIVKGKVERGRRRSKIEVYSKDRFFTMTGNVTRNLPVTECQPQLDELYLLMGGPADIHDSSIDLPEREDDNAVLTRMFEAVNGEKARNLYNGEWGLHYQSQSEADFAFIDITAFYTQNRFQICRIFWASGLGQRDKAKRIDYVYRMINRAFDRMLPPVDFEGLRIAVENCRLAAEAGKAALPEGSSNAAAVDRANAALGPQDDQSEPGGRLGPSSMTGSPTRVNPPGLVGEIADFIYASAPRPVYEIALAGAIGLVAGIGARAFNVSGTGLNQYILVLAPTGTGKEAIHSGISKLIQNLKPTFPSIMDFVGPDEIRSDAALLKWIARQPVVLSIVGEFGLRLQQMSGPFASPHELGLKKVMLDLFSKSGFGETLGAMAYADKEKNTEVINSPCFTMIGESTPERFYEALDEKMISEGLLPRFTFIEYLGKRPPPNNDAFKIQPSQELLQRFGSFAAHVKTLMAAVTGTHVVMQPEAFALFEEFNDFCDAEINDPKARDVKRQFWSRAHLKAMKLAATIAIGVDWLNPSIDRQTAQWACDFIVEDVKTIMGRFESGDYGDSNPFASDELKQIDEAVSVFAKIVKGTPEEAERKYGLLPELHKAGIITQTAISKALFQRASFRRDRLGSTNALKRTLQHLLDGDELREMPKSQMSKEFGISARSFVISRPSRFFGGK